MMQNGPNCVRISARRWYAETNVACRTS